MDRRVESVLGMFNPDFLPGIERRIFTTHDLGTRLDFVVDDRIINMNGPALADAPDFHRDVLAIRPGGDRQPTVGRIA